MIILANTTDTLEVVLSGAVTTNELRCYSSFRDVTTTAYTPGRVVTNTNGSTAVVAVSAPAASTQRVVDYLSVFNSDTANATVTVRYDANGTEYELFKVTLGIGEKLEYVEGQGFRIISNAGSVKVANVNGTNAVSSSMQSVVLGSDVVNNNAIANTIADVTGLSFPVTNGNTYFFRFIIRYTAQAITTGARWSINGPTVSAMAFKVSTPLGATVNSTDMTSDTHAIAFDAPATATTGSPNNTTGQIAIIEGILTADADGDIIARFSSEVSASAITAKAGSIVYYQQTL